MYSLKIEEIMRVRVLNTVDSEMHRKVEKLVQLVLVDFKLDVNIVVHFDEVEESLVHRKELGALSVLGSGLFGIQIATGIDLVEQCITICHELIHVRQLETKQLIFLDDKSAIFNGQHYSAETPYADQPWEIEAFSQETDTFRKVIGMTA